MNFSKKSAALLITVPVILSAMAVSAAAEDTTTLAHWKFQNVPEYYMGDVENDMLTFRDLTGNGNDVTAVIEGAGGMLDIFTWDDGCDMSDASRADTSLKFDNSKEQSAKFDEFDPSETEYTGGYTSGKYFETIDGAPLNSMTLENGYTFEVIFKVSPDWNTNYNRYTGLFSRQGVVEGVDEPAFSMALGECGNGEADGRIGENGSTGVQYVHIWPDDTKVNLEYRGGDVHADEWVHFMIANNAETGKTSVYFNGELESEFDDQTVIRALDPSFKWDVGVGRKSGVGKATVNEMHPEGLIRRLFCGSISEIRVTEGALSIEESLLNQATAYDLSQFAPAEETEGGSDTAPTTFDGGITAALLSAMAAGYVALKKKH